VIGDPERTFAMAGRLEEEGIIVNPVVPPAVPVQDSLIRVSVMASFLQEELADALRSFKAVGTRLGLIGERRTS
jgi:7-keto-8-aminopelargonate synthetase-like enzyme